ncbi:MAG: response regulator [Betaproteobacteria bacterium]|nr:response regulator [Betaproteobacteria bacterium]
MSDVVAPPPRRALVVDDDPVMVEFVSRTLAKAGFSVESCGDGMSALSLFRAAPFDVVVADVRMPKLSGLGFLQNLRLQPGSPHRVVLLSSMDDGKTRRDALNAGAVAYLVKPATSQAIVEAATGAPPTTS